MQTIPIGAVELALCSARERVERKDSTFKTFQSHIHSLSTKIETNIVADVAQCMVDEQNVLLLLSRNDERINLFLFM